MIYLIGVIVTFFLAFILLGKKNKNAADFILFSWFLVIGLHLTLYYMAINDVHQEYPVILGIAFAFPLLHGPLLYLYTAALTDQSKNWKITALHFVVPTLFVIAIADFFFLSQSQQYEVFQNKGIAYDTVNRWHRLAVKSSGVLYIVWTLYLLKVHKKNITDQFSNTDRINLYWILYLIAGLTLVWFFVFLGNDQLLFLTAVLMVILMGYFGINQVGIFSPQLKTKEIESATNTENIASNAMDSSTTDISPLQKYEKSGLTKAMADELYNKLKVAMEEKEYFTNAELKMSDLAEALEVHPNILSQVINTYESKNFYDYINELRIQKFIGLLSDLENKKFTIMSLAYDCGFNSKSSFNKYFKKVTTQTPTEYIASMRY
jgi:AraC-like DNA-binding protein